MRRLINAFRNSRAGLTYLARHEAAFRTEIALLVISVPVAWWLAESLGSFIWLVGSIVVIMIVEMLNTGIEQVCNGLSRSDMEEIKIAKDCGSAAVLLATLLAGAVWLAALYSHFFG
jgi:diacylglycerol kinase (ATP)